MAGFVAVLIGAVLASACQMSYAADSFDDTVAPFLRQYCVGCHGAKKAEAHLNLSRMTDSIKASDTKVWEAVLKQLSQRTMPPDDQPQPTSKQIESVTGWIRDSLLTETWKGLTD